jgi:phosphatidylglycerol:prolipoprotein diacylglycerol transferase
MPTLAAILHTLDPFIVQFTPSFGLRWYGLLYASGLLCAWMIMRAVARRGRAGLTQRQVDDFITEVVIGVVVGARLGHALIYDRVLFTTFTPSFPFWELLAVHKGGLSSHGGMAGLLAIRGPLRRIVPDAAGPVLHQRATGPVPGPHGQLDQR